MSSIPEPPVSPHSSLPDQSIPAGNADTPPRHASSTHILDDSSSSSYQSAPFSFTHQLTSPDQPSSASSSSGPEPRSSSDDTQHSRGDAVSDASRRSSNDTPSSNSEGSRRSATSGDSLPFSFHDDITRPRQTATATATAAEMEPGLSTATDLTEVTAPPLTPAPSHGPVHLPFRQPKEADRSRLPRSISTPHPFPRLHSRTTSGFTVEDLQLAGESQRQPRPPSHVSLASYRPFGVPDTVNTNELWIDPFIYRAIVGRTYHEEHSFSDADRATVQSWLRSRLLATGSLRSVWTNKLPWISLDPDERSAPLVPPRDGIVILHIALHRVWSGDDGWEGSPEIIIKNRHELLAPGEDTFAFDTRIAREPPPYLRLFPCFCTGSLGLLRRPTDTYDRAAKVDLHDYAECPNRRRSRERQRSGSVPIPRGGTRLRAHSRGSRPAIAHIGELPNHPSIPSGTVNRPTRRLTVNPDHAPAVSSPPLISTSFPVIDEKAWGVARPVPIEMPRVLTPIPEPVSARPTEPAFLPHLVLSPSDFAVDQLAHQALFRPPAALPQKRLPSVLPHWSPDVPQDDRFGPSLISLTRPEIPPVPLSARTSPANTSLSSASELGPTVSPQALDLTPSEADDTGI